MSTAVEAAAPPGDGRTGRRTRNAALLFDAASELLGTRSFDDLTIEDICDHAGVGRATFFRIYETKSGLLREFNRRLARDAAHRLGGPQDGGVLDALDRIRTAIVEGWRDAPAGQIGMAREFITASSLLEPHAAHPELLGLVRDAIEAGIDSGELDGTVPVDLAAALALGQLIAPIAYSIAGGDLDIDDMSSVLLDQWYLGMTSRRSPR